LLAHNVPHEWIEEMDDDTLIGWVYRAQTYDGTHEWSDLAGHPVPKSKN